MPFYKEVADTARNAGTRVIAIAAEDPPLNKAFLASHGIEVEKALSQTESGVRVPQVPALILVRGDGTIIDSWLGRATKTALQRAVIKVVGKS